MRTTHEPIYAWRDPAHPYGNITITAIDWWHKPDSKAIEANRRRMVNLVVTKWHLQPPSFSWKAIQRADFEVWDALLGAVRGEDRLPNTLVRLAYADQVFFLNGFRLRVLGVNQQDLYDRFGRLLTRRFMTLPPPWELRGGIIIKEPSEDPNWFLWLETIFDAAKETLKGG